VIGLPATRGSSTHSVPASLVRTRPMVLAGLIGAVNRLSPPLRRIAAYHLGWRDAEGRAIEGDGGKALRPAITLVAAEAVGGAASAALPGAVALELVHNFSLIHDDVMDGDVERRHRPTVWALFGIGEAIVAGDALHSLAQELLLEDHGPRARRAALELHRATAEMILGQSEDLAYESRLDVSEDEALGMSSHKTGALLACAGTLGALLGGGDDRQVEALQTFGRNVGLAFQAVDDVLGIWGDPAVTGKPAASDLRQRKKTIPVVHGLRVQDAQSRRIAKILGNGELTEDGLAEIVTLLDELGCRRWTIEVADRHLGLALEALEAANLVPGPTEELREIALFVTRREF
jgi:geranylgeranyl diphosphate synthase type I